MEDSGTCVTQVTQVPARSIFLGMAVSENTGLPQKNANGDREGDDLAMVLDGF